MEYRKRQRRARNRRIRHDSYAGTVFCVVLLFAAIVYLIGVSSAGTWMAKSIVAPVFRTLGITATDEINGETEAHAAASTLVPPITDTIRFDTSTRYALQMGVYTNPENAAKQSAALQALGAGGYICTDNGKYRVLAACYPNESDLSSVRARLSDEGLESSVYLISRPAAEWIITADKKQIDTVRSTLETLLELGNRLYALIYAFDNEAQEIPVGKAGLASIRSDLETSMSEIQMYSDTNQTSKQIAICLQNLLSAFDETGLYDGDDRTIFTAKLKHLHLTVEDAVRQLFDTAESS